VQNLQPCTSGAIPVFFVNKQQHPFPRAVYRRLRAATTRTSQKLLPVVRRRKRWPCPRTWPPAGVIYHAPAAKGTRQSKNTPTAPRSGCVRLCTQQHSPVACEGACASARGAFVGLINAHGRLPGQTPAHSRAKCALTCENPAKRRRSACVHTSTQQHKPAAYEASERRPTTSSEGLFAHTAACRRLDAAGSQCPA